MFTNPQYSCELIIVNLENHIADGKEYGEGVNKDYTLLITDLGAVAYPSTDVHAVVVQMVEHLPSKQVVASSSLVYCSIWGGNSVG